ncbi:PREDICTED: putative F-box protein At4g21240 [Camelina sativa]|uniref:F-box protein At4g21240 n=1 Tax=Camelina sativa TaxID=90675 RepID=A0ABM0V5P2_CAMSA|nr:PREDICTED: putative F-box protein At4g21240 [Camelina sativa]
MEEKTKEIHRTTTQSLSTSFHGDNKSDDDEVFSDHKYIPVDLTRDILMRLPAKSILRFRCVSKLWWSITTQQDFINSFAVRQSSIPRQRLLLTFNQDDTTQIFCSLPFDEKSITTYSDVKSFHFTPPIKGRYEYYRNSVHGLISFQNFTEVIIWNPTMKEHVTLSKPIDMSKYVVSFLGYDPTENTYKLLSLAEGLGCRDTYQKPQILTLGSQEAWRVTENSPLHYFKGFGYSINGVVYYEANISRKSVEIVIMSFDVRSEQFKSLQIPGDVVGSTLDNLIHESIMSYQGKLAWVCNNFDFIKIWVLQDADKQEWSYKDNIIPLPQRDLLRSATLKGATDSGEFIYLRTKLRFKDISAFYYDPVRKSVRSVKALEYDTFRRFYGSCNEPMYCLEPIPDHIESLMSLKDICSPFV